jgi:hypothetical protein
MQIDIKPQFHVIKYLVYKTVVFHYKKLVAAVEFVGLEIQISE